ncbi:MAG: hypothetical protein R3E32_21210 [Chitinophagales bacterium]
MNCTKYFTIFLLFIAISIVCSCDITPDCTTEDDLAEFETLQGMADAAIYDSIFLLPHTLDTSVMVNQTYRIDDAYTYDALLPTANCPDCRLPSINFDTHTLIGLYLTEPCLAIYVRKLVKIDEKNYRYLVKIVQDNRCITASCFNFSFNFITVPKLPADATVTYEVGHITTECDC